MLFTVRLDGKGMPLLATVHYGKDYDNGAALAKRLRLPVAYDFRQNDIVGGGQGAP